MEVCVWVFLALSCSTQKTILREQKCFRHMQKSVVVIRFFTLLVITTYRHEPGEAVLVSQQGFVRRSGPGW